MIHLQENTPGNFLVRWISTVQE